MKIYLLLMLIGVFVGYSFLPARLESKRVMALRPFRDQRGA